MLWPVHYSGNFFFELELRCVFVLEVFVCTVGNISLVMRITILVIKVNAGGIDHRVSFRVIQLAS
jgi:hypothetical protein